MAQEESYLQGRSGYVVRRVAPHEPKVPGTSAAWGEPQREDRSGQQKGGSPLAPDKGRHFLGRDGSRWGVAWRPVRMVP